MELLSKAIESFNATSTEVLQAGSQQESTVDKLPTFDENRASLEEILEVGDVDFVTRQEVAQQRIDLTQLYLHNVVVVGLHPGDRVSSKEKMPHPQVCVEFLETAGLQEKLPKGHCLPVIVECLIHEGSIEFESMFAGRSCIFGFGYNALRFVVNVKALEPTIDKLRKSTHSHDILQLEIPMHAVEDAANQ